MLHEDQRLIKPADIASQVPWEKLEAVVVLGLKKQGERNALFMSTLTVDELCVLSKQLDAHLTCILGPMQEGG